MAGTFATNRLAEIPPKLNGPEGQAFARAMGSVQDAELPLLRIAALSRLPYYCPDDALDGVGAWLKIERYAGEEDGTAPVGTTEGTGYRGRLCRAWPTWEIAASPQAVEDSLRAFGIERVRVIEDWEAELAPGDWYSRFWVVIESTEDSPFGPSLLGSATTLGTWVLGVDWTVDAIRAVKRQILKWKSHQSYPVGIYVLFGTDNSILGIGTVLGEWELGSGGSAFIPIGRLFGFDTSMPFVLGGYQL